MSTDKIKIKGNNYEITPDDLNKVRKLEDEYVNWHAKKLVDESTPLIYLTGTISKQLNSEGCEGSLLGHAVNLITQKPEEATVILERAGFNVLALPSVF